MKVVDGTHVYSYQEWEKLPEVQELNAEKENCVTCDGSGLHECKCGDEHDCRDCDGTGKEKGEVLLDLYNQSVKEELKKLLLWKKSVEGGE